jgi:hypothetical protein
MTSLPCYLSPCRQSVSLRADAIEPRSWDAGYQQTFAGGLRVLTIDAKMQLVAEEAVGGSTSF